MIILTILLLISLFWYIDIQRRRILLLKGVVEESVDKQEKLTKAMAEFTEKQSKFDVYIQTEVDRNRFRYFNLAKTIDLAVDVDPPMRHMGRFRPGRSWAVIAINGKPEYVQFVEMGSHEMIQIKEFLKIFEGTNMTIDAPFGTVDMIKPDNWIP